MMLGQPNPAVLPARVGKELICIMNSRSRPSPPPTPTAGRLQLPAQAQRATPPAKQQPHQ